MYKKYVIRKNLSSIRSEQIATADCLELWWLPFSKNNDKKKLPGKYSNYEQHEFTPNSEISDLFDLLTNN